MARPELLDRWHGFANGWITPLHNIKEKFKGYRRRLDADHPSWKAKYDPDPRGYGKHDARREFFVSLQTILTNTQLCYSFIRDSLTDPVWWEKNGIPYSDSKAETNLREYAVMTKWFTFHQAAMTAEETIRSIVRSSTPGTYSIKPEAVPRIEFARLYKEVLRAATLSQHQEFFDIMRETRNTIHTNGFYSPPDGRPKSFSYRGQTLDFIPGRGLEWLNDTLAIQLVHDLGDRMFEIVVAKPAVDFAYCPGSAGALPLPVVEGESE